ncbi:MAG: M20/M25/M40 family metallo-hydrolase [Acidobacteria bacterium]|nr:M20/M25/M40 family metallo-hydrolase [Acidobacteriota bacterium]
MMRSLARSATLLLVTAALVQSQAIGDSERIIAEALKASALETNLRQLTDEIGGRVPGTSRMQRAVEWAVSAFRAAGGQNVHTERFEIANSWAEGPTEIKVVAPEQFTLHAVSLGWAPALGAHRHVRLVDAGQGTAEDFQRAGKINEAIVLIHSEEMKTWEDLFAEYLKAPAIIDRALKGQALAIAFESTRSHDLLYRHTNSVSGEIDRLPMVLIAREDAGRIARLLASGQELFADLAIPNRIGGPITADNVVAEIVGSEQAGEFVLLGAHLDSWELGTGALDNGCNAALVIDAVRAIKASGLAPRRSIRFVLFSAEEEGMLGSRAYVMAHRGELDQAAGVVVFDAGTGRTTGFSLGGRKDILGAVTPLIAPLQQLGATALTTDAEWGTDHFDFMLEGVPTFVANQEPANYLTNYHAQSDTFDKVDLPQLKKHVAEAAELTFALANLQQRIGPRLDRAQIEQTLRATGLDQQLQTFGIWQQWEHGQRGRAQ